MNVRGIHLWRIWAKENQEYIICLWMGLRLLFLIVWTISWRLILWRIALVFEWTRIIVWLTKIKFFLEKKQLQSNEAEIPLFEQLRSLKEWWRHDDESYLWLIKNETSNKHLTTAETGKILHYGIRDTNSLQWNRLSISWFPALIFQS